MRLTVTPNHRTSIQTAEEPNLRPANTRTMQHFARWQTAARQYPKTTVRRDMCHVDQCRSDPLCLIRYASDNHKGTSWRRASCQSDRSQYFGSERQIAAT